MALYALAKTCGEDEIRELFGALNLALSNEYGADKVSPLIEQYKAAVITLSNAKD
jgi:hypothetical protein